MHDEIGFSSQLPDIKHAESLGDVKAYISQTTQRRCCYAKKFHRHDWFEIAWLTQESSHYFVDFRQYNVANGSLVFISPGQVHGWFDMAPDVKLRVIGFQPELFALDMLDVRKTLVDLPFFVENTAPVYTVPVSVRPLFEQLFATAYERVEQAPERSEMLIRAYLGLILVEAQNALQIEPAANLQQAPAPVRLTRRFRLAVEHNYLERKRVQDYAIDLGVTTNHLIETVRQTVGMTPKQIIQDRLLLEAKRLLVHTSLSSAEIGLELSFPNPTQFGRWFRTNAGVPPGRFRQHALTIS